MKKTQIFTAIAAALALSACQPHDHDHDHDHDGHDHAEHQAAEAAPAAAKEHDHDEHGHDEHEGHDHHDEHGHDEHQGHDHHDEHGHDKHEGHDHHDEHGHDEHEGHDHHDEHGHDEHEGHDHEGEAGLGAHVHGEGHLTLIQEGHELMVTLNLPTDSLWGFEHAPQNDQEKAKVEQVLQDLTSGHRWFELSADAQCEPEQAQITPPAGLTDPDASGHMELEAQWSWHCEAAVNSLNVTLFSQYPQLHRLHLQRLTEAGSGGGDITNEAPGVKW